MALGNSVIRGTSTRPNRTITGRVRPNRGVVSFEQRAAGVAKEFQKNLKTVLERVGAVYTSRMI